MVRLRRPLQVEATEVHLHMEEVTGSRAVALGVVVAGGEGPLTVAEAAGAAIGVVATAVSCFVVAACRNETILTDVFSDVAL